MAYRFRMALHRYRAIPWRLGICLLQWAAVVPAGAESFANSQAIAIPGSGTATPYPSTITVSGVSGPISGLVVTLHGFSHMNPGDVDLLLAGPNGRSVVLMSDAAGASVSNLTLGFTDNGTGLVPTPLSSGLYGAFNYDDASGPDVFPAPAPSTPPQESVAALADPQPNGVWSLYVVDDSAGGAGQITGGWSIEMCLASDLATALQYEETFGQNRYALPGETFSLPFRFSAVNPCRTVVTGFDGPVTVALKPGTGTTGAVLSGTTTIHAVNGQADFNDLRIDRAGIGYVLVASAPGLPSVETTPFIVSPPRVYVRPVEAGGDDSMDGQTWATARASLSAAMEVTGGGSEVWVAAGRYTADRISVKPAVRLFGGFAGNESAQEQRDWRAKQTTLEGVGGIGYILRSSPGGVTVVDGFTIRNAGSGFGAVNSVPKSQLEVRNCVFGDNNGGAIISYDSARLSNNLITGCQQPAVALLAGTSVLENNTITGNAIHGVYISWTSGLQPQVTLRNNLITGNLIGVLRTNAAIGLVVSHNNVYGNTQADYLGFANPTGVNGNISADPFFANASSGDFRLSEGSICIDAGDDALALPAVLDLDARERKVGTHTDIGAYEYIPPGAITRNDLVQALKMAGGLVPATPDDLARLDAVGNGAASIDLSDIVRLARRVAGLEPNP